MAKKLEQWKNTLAVEKIVEGMNAASSNARRLLNDASALFDLERYPSAGVAPAKTDTVNL